MSNYNPLKNIGSTRIADPQLESIRNVIKANKERIDREENRNARIEQRQQQQLDVAEKTLVYTKWILWLTIAITVVTFVSLAVARY